MKKINFAQLTVQNLDYKDVNYDIHYSISDVLCMQGANVTEHMLGHKIYDTRDENGKPAEVELNDEEVAIILKYAKGFPYIVQQAILDKLKD